MPPELASSPEVPRGGMAHLRGDKLRDLLSWDFAWDWDRDQLNVKSATLEFSCAYHGTVSASTGVEVLLNLFLPDGASADQWYWDDADEAFTELTAILEAHLDAQGLNPLEIEIVGGLVRQELKALAAHLIPYFSCDDELFLNEAFLKDAEAWYGDRLDQWAQTIPTLLVEELA